MDIPPPDLRPDAIEPSQTTGQVLPTIARAAVTSALASSPEAPPRFGQGFLASAHPVFVTIRDERGQLRGCVGTLRARCRDIAEETWRLAREAAFSDDRFQPVTRDEVQRLHFEVSVVRPLEEVINPDRLDPHRYGVVVSTQDGRRGALLPDIEGVDTVPSQLALARRKGGIAPSEAARVQCFRVFRFAD